MKLLIIFLIVFLLFVSGCNTYIENDCLDNCTDKIPSYCHPDNRNISGNYYSCRNQLEEYCDDICLN